MPEGASSLVDNLKRIATEDSIENLDAGLHRAVQPVARTLLLDGVDPTPGALTALEKSPAMAAWAAAVSLRSLDVVDFWQPLLKHCLTGSSTAPVSDLKSTSEQARALMEVVGSRPSSEMRDKVLLLATEAAARVEKWIPAERKKGKRSGPKAARYKRGAFHEQDEEGNPVQREATPRRVKKVKPASKIKAFFAWVFTVLVVLAMGAGVAWFAMTQNKSEPVTVESYSALVKQVEGKALEETELVITMGSVWVRKRPEHREADLRLLLTTGKREGATSIRAMTADGELLGRVPVEGPVTWGKLALTADRQRDAAEAEVMEAEDRHGVPVKQGDDGTFDRPLTAEELSKLKDAPPTPKPTPEE